MGIGNGTRGASLSSEKVLEAQIGAANETIRRLTAVLAAVLMDKHRGRVLVESASVDAAYGDQTQPNGFMVDVATLHPLGQHRLQVLLPNGDTYVPQPLAIAAPVIDPSSSGPCEYEWHRSGIGIRCPKCGGTTRIS
jgi:hypothetical protein